MLPEQYCSDAAAPAGSNLHYAALFLAPDRRRALFALFALLAEVDAAACDFRDHAVSQLRLHWWLEEVGRLPSAPTNHPVGREISRLLRTKPECATELRGFITAAVDLQHSAPVETYDQWIERFANVHGRLWHLAARAAAQADPAGAERVSRIGSLLAALEDVQRLPRVLGAGRCPLPASELTRHGLTVADIGVAAAHDRVSACIREILARLRGDLLLALRAPALRANRDLLFAGVMAGLGVSLCLELEQEGAALLRQRTALTPIRKWWITWKTRLSWPRPSRCRADG